MGSNWPELGFRPTPMAPKPLLLALSRVTQDTGSLGPDPRVLLCSVSHCCRIQAWREESPWPEMWQRVPVGAGQGWEGESQGGGWTGSGSPHPWPQAAAVRNTLTLTRRTESRHPGCRLPERGLAKFISRRNVKGTGRKTRADLVVLQHLPSKRQQA